MSEAGTSDPDDELPSFAPGAASTQVTANQVTATFARYNARIRRRRRAMMAVVASFALLACACVIAGILAWRDIQATRALVEARQTQRAGTLVLEALLVAESGSAATCSRGIRRT